MFLVKDPPVAGLGVAVAGPRLEVATMAGALDRLLVGATIEDPPVEARGITTATDPVGQEILVDNIQNFLKDCYRLLHFFSFLLI